MRKSFRFIRIVGMAGFAGLLAISPVHNANAQERMRAFEQDRYYAPYRVFPEPLRHERHERAGDSTSFPLPEAACVLPVANTWYYCESAKSYYPYAPECKEGWLSVPAVPPTAARDTAVLR
jgi:hypothetical protein